jgi:hypothetical protein
MGIEIMKIMKTLGFAGILGVALALSSNSLILAETPLKNSAHLTGMQKTDNVVHRVNNAVASSQRYAKSGPSGYKWGQGGYEPRFDAIGSGSAKSIGGYKWGRSNTAEQAGSKWGRS